jgi:hypothetical protein
MVFNATFNNISVISWPALRYAGSNNKFEIYKNGSRKSPK